MTLSKTRILVTTALAALLIAGGVVEPASAASPFSGDKTIVTIKGHVIDPDGKGIKGILVSAGCPCDGYTTDPYASGRDHTSSTGFYSFKVERQWVKYTYFQDSTESSYRSGVRRSTTSSGYIIDATFKRYSVVSGTVTATNGGRADGTWVRFTDATTGKGRGSAYANSKGVYTARLKAGSYKVQFAYKSLYANTVW